MEESGASKTNSNVRESRWLAIEANDEKAEVQVRSLPFAFLMDDIWNAILYTAAPSVWSGQSDFSQSHFSLL